MRIARSLRLSNQIRYHGHSHSHNHKHKHNHNHNHSFIFNNKHSDRGSKEATRITLIGLGSNVFLTLAKGTGGVVWNSASLLADAVHSMSDLISDMVTLFAYNKARTVRDKAFPYGYGKWEPIGSLTISGLLLSAGLGAGYHSFDLLRKIVLTTPTTDAATTNTVSTTINTTLPENVDITLLGDLALYSLDNPAVAALAVGLAAGSVVVKEALFWATLRVARKMNSDVLLSNAWHHRADSASGLVALAGVAGVYCGVPVLDPIGGLLVSGLIVQASVGMIVPAMKDLMDQAVEGVGERVRGCLEDLQAKDSNIVGFHSIRARKMGPDLLVDLQLQVNPRISVSMSHQITENVRHELYEKIDGLTEALIHVDVEEHDHSLDPRPSVPTSDIEHDIARKTLKGMEHLVRSIAHLKVHYLKGGMEVEAEILLAREDISLREAFDIADKVQKKIMGFPGVIAADVHLETSEHIGQEGRKRRRPMVTLRR